MIATSRSLIDNSKEIAALTLLVDALLKEVSTAGKLAILLQAPQTIAALSDNEWLRELCSLLSDEERLAVFAVLAIGQGPHLFAHANEEPLYEMWKALVVKLAVVEQFYAPIGGIVGYHLNFLRFLHSNTSDSLCNWRKPISFDLINDAATIAQAIHWGIEHLGEICEIYLVGGAADRLRFVDEASGAALPAAALPFCGRTLLEGLFRDIQAREYLHHKIFGRQIITPIILMTSSDKDNDTHVRAICASSHWFGRPMDSFRIISQPMAPMIDEEGKWVMEKPLVLQMKPGGHGVIWTLARQQGCFAWLRSHGRKKMLLRQINNPIAGLDNGLLSLAGIGCHEDKSFGFATCAPLQGAAEGRIALVEESFQGLYRYHHSNIEYTTAFADKLAAEDAFPANSNILFADLDAVEDAVESVSFPGLLINMKSSVDSIAADGTVTRLQAGRLESTMQNISDYMIDIADHRLADSEIHCLRSFTTLNSRHKTISVAKCAYEPNKSLLGTQLGAFYDKIRNCHELLADYCHYTLPPLPDEANFLERGPSFLCDYLPALGPLYSIIGQKIQYGTLAAGSELRLEISSLQIERLSLSGSLLIMAENSLGTIDEKGVVQYGVGEGRCILRDVIVVNKGIDWSSHERFWMGQFIREEALHIAIYGDGEFFAEGVTFQGAYFIEVPKGYRITAYISDGSVAFKKERIAKPSWNWHYSFNQALDQPIQLNLLDDNCHRRSFI